MRKQPAVTERTKARLRQAFWELYTEKPLSQISVREITDAAGYNRGTFYLYFKDVRDMLAQIEDGLLGMVEELVRQRLIQDGELRLEENMGVILGLAQRYAAHFSVLLGDKGDPRFRARFKAIVAPLVQACVEPDPDATEAERRLVLEFYLSGILAAVTAWLEDDGDVPIDRLIALIAREVLG